MHRGSFLIHLQRVFGFQLVKLTLVPCECSLWARTAECVPTHVDVAAADQTVQLTLVSVHPTGGVHPTHLAVSNDGQDLFVANVRVLSCS